MFWLFELHDSRAQGMQSCLNFYLTRVYGVTHDL